MKILIFLLFVGLSHAQSTFRNPVIDRLIEPSVVKHQGYYYMVLLANNGRQLDLLKSSTLSNLRDGERKEIRQNPGTHGMFGPNIQAINGDLYIYFAIANLQTINDYQMYVIKCLDPEDPLEGGWSSETMILPENEPIPFDGTVLQYNNGSLYFLWTGVHSMSEQTSSQLYIAGMEDPMTLSTPRVLLRSPTESWERNGPFPVNEAPAILQKGGRTFLVFSASSWAVSDYCLGIMGIDEGKDPLVASNWWDDVHHCVFSRNDEESVFGTGHASFVQSPDESETWILYQARHHEDPSNTSARIQKLEWEMNGPKFPMALGTHRELEVPSGE